MKLGHVSVQEAKALDPKYVAGIQKDTFESLESYWLETVEGLKPGKLCLYHTKYPGPGQLPGFMVVRVTSVSGGGDYMKVRVTDGSVSWRIEGTLCILKDAAFKSTSVLTPGQKAAATKRAKAQAALIERYHNAPGWGY